MAGRLVDTNNGRAQEMVFYESSFWRGRECEREMVDVLTMADWTRGQCQSRT